MTFPLTLPSPPIGGGRGLRRGGKGNVNTVGSKKTFQVFKPFNFSNGLNAFNL